MATEDPFTAALLSKLNAIEASATADQSASEIKTLLENGIDSVHYVNASVDNEHLADNAVDSDEIAAGAIDTAHIGNLQVTAAKVAADVATQAELDAVSVIANASATTGKAIAMAIVFGS